MRRNVVATTDGTILFLTFRRYKIESRSYFIKINNKIMEFIAIKKIKERGRLFFIIKFINTVKKERN